MLNQIPPTIVDRIRYWIDSFLENPEPWFKADQRNPAHVRGIITDLIEIRDNYRIDPETQATAQAILDKLEGRGFYLEYDRDADGLVKTGSPRWALANIFGEDIVAKIDDKLTAWMDARELERVEGIQRRAAQAAIDGAKLTSAYLGMTPREANEAHEYPGRFPRGE